MTRIALATALAFAFALPAAAQTLTVLLPVISFPDPIVAPSTKGCVADAVRLVCSLSE